MFRPEPRETGAAAAVWGRGLLAAAILLGLGCGCLSRSRRVVYSPYSYRHTRTVSARDIFGKGRAGYSSTRRRTESGVVSDAKASLPQAFALREGDHVLIYLRGIPEEQMIEDVVDEEGCITLPYLSRIKAAGLTTAQLEKKIRQAYISKKIYNDVTVNVVQPTRGFYVRGEVKQPGRFPLVGEMTLSRAIAQAGGYTEFANPGKIRIIRGDRTFYVNAKVIERHPERDIPITPGDVIVVPRSIF